jgi:DNA-binding transcriptional regulator LsrR (DeoR family)
MDLSVAQQTQTNSRTTEHLQVFSNPGRCGMMQTHIVGSAKNTREEKKIRRLSMLAEIASMYYERDMTQTEIAKTICLSRTRISRLLKSAKEKGLVNIHVNYVEKRLYEFEDILKRKYSLKEVFVLNDDGLDYDNSRKQLGDIAARYVESIIHDKEVIGISWGRSLMSVVEALRPNLDIKLEIVQIMGGAMIENQSIDVPGLISKMVRKYDSIGYQLNAPLYVKDAAMRRTLKNAPVIQKTLNKARNADIILTGIGNMSEPTFSYMFSGFKYSDDFAAMRRQGAVGVICAQAYDIHGLEASDGFNEKIVGLTLKELKNVKTVLAIAAGERKSAAVLGALRGRYVNVLVTDKSCAIKMARLEKETETKN